MAGKALPTEAEWEFAAHGGLDGAPFSWGDEFTPGGRHLANTWQGTFPYRDLAQDGFAGRAPVGSFPANGYGLYDTSGNVWEWTTDWYSDQHLAEVDSPCCVPRNPRGGAEALSYDPRQPHIRIPRKVIKGGSYLCAPNYCRRYRPAARHPQMIDAARASVASFAATGPMPARRLPQLTAVLEGGMAAGLLLLPWLAAGVLLGQPLGTPLDLLVSPVRRWE